MRKRPAPECSSILPFHCSSPLRAFPGRWILLGAAAPEKKSGFCGPDRKLVAASANFEKTIALALLTATLPQIPY